MASQVAPFWVLEETSGHLRRETRQGATLPHPDEFDLRLYQVNNYDVSLLHEKSHPVSSRTEATQERLKQVQAFLRDSGLTAGTIVSSHRLVSPRGLLPVLSETGLHFVLEISAATRLRFLRHDATPTPSSAREEQVGREWVLVDIAEDSTADYYAADLGVVEYAGVNGLRCFAVSTGRIDTFQRGTLYGLTSLDLPLEQLAKLLSWVRWIRVSARKLARATDEVPQPATATKTEANPSLSLPVRANLRIAKRIDEAVAASAWETDQLDNPATYGKLVEGDRPLNVVELFAGAGGMGLGFLLAHGSGTTRFRIIHSAEIQPIYTQTLRWNHQYLRDNSLVADDAVPQTVKPCDLRSAKDVIKADVLNAGGVDILIGGPPCQGFSSANRNSWSSSNPNNQLVDTYLDYVDLLKPRVLLMENVQGILWTRRHDANQSTLSVAEHVVKRLSATGYLFFPKLLDAAWYGVPQHRNRFFLLGIHEDLGYRKDDFGKWGPFPQPTHGPGKKNGFTTVSQAIADLPVVANGHTGDEMDYSVPEDAGEFVTEMRIGASTGVVTDHIVSRQADYVIERYRQIPEGGNWENIIELMTNYASVGRTHSNIYRRLKWHEPSITIGHYRKSMIVHPEQHRGLSLREAARLQSFPDWFRLAGSPNSLDGGLTHKQQQLANAVCPLVTRAVAKYLITL